MSGWTYERPDGSKDVFTDHGDGNGVLESYDADGNVIASHSVNRLPVPTAPPQPLVTDDLVPVAEAGAQAQSLDDIRNAFGTMQDVLGTDV